MGDFEKGNVVESTTQGSNMHSQLITGVVLIIGLFAPIMITMYNYEFDSELSIQSLFWVYDQPPYMPNIFGFSLTPLYYLPSMFPFLLLRIVPVSQINRYYNGKTTRKRAFIASFIGDVMFLIISLPALFTTIMYGFYFSMIIPLPIQFIVATLILWRFSVPEAITPWEIEEKPKSWWEKTPDSQQKKSDDEDDQLW